MEGIEQIPQAPRNDHIVVKPDCGRDYHAANSNPTQIWMKFSPSTDGALAQPLADSKFDQKQWNSFNDQHNDVRDEKSSCSNGNSLGLEAIQSTKSTYSPPPYV